MDHLNLMLEKLGEALFLRAKEREEATMAKEAVEYLEELGVFADQQG